MIRPGIVSHVKSTGQVAVSDHLSALPVNPTPYRSYVGGRKSGFHSAPKVGDTVVLLYGPNNRLLSVVPFLDAKTATDGMYSLQPGESAEYHSDGRVAGYLPNTGGGTIYNDPTHTISLIANATGITETGTMTITGPLTVSGIIDANGGIALGGSVLGPQVQNGNVVGSGCTITFPHGLSISVGGVSHIIPLMT